MSLSVTMVPIMAPMTVKSQYGCPVGHFFDKMVLRRVLQEPGSHLVTGISGNILGKKMDCRVQEEIQKGPEYAVPAGQRQYRFPP